MKVNSSVWMTIYRPFHDLGSNISGLLVRELARKLQLFINKMDFEEAGEGPDVEEL